MTQLLAAVAAALALMTSVPAGAAEIKVVASIKPVHSLVAGIMAGVGEPELIVSGPDSPHDHALRPSEARAIAGADVVFWIGPGLETFLAGALAELAGEARVVALADAPGVMLLPLREGGVWGAHNDGPRVRDTGSGPEADPSIPDVHPHGARDSRNLHIWLDPANARAMVAAIVTGLARADPDNRATYEANGRRLADRLRALEAEMAERLVTVQERPFIVFHDAYRYLEHRFGLSAVGSITASPESQPGAATVSALRDLIAERGVVCVFSEPQFESQLVTRLTEGTDTGRAVLDPLGTDLAVGPDHYFDLMRRNAEAIAGCLG